MEALWRNFAAKVSKETKEQLVAEVESQGAFVFNVRETATGLFAGGNY